jgi:parallel beta-helix repeat protein
MNFRPHCESLERRDLPSTLVVHPGASIQAAVNAATPGSTILIEPGVYKQAVTINKADLNLIGLPGGPVVLQNPGGKANGISVTTKGDGLLLDNLTVRGFDEDGVLLEGVDGFLLSRITAVKNHDYGLFPGHCNHGLIEDCFASGSNDTGIYVGQSRNVTIAFNTARDNVNGIEVENCTGVKVLRNLVTANTVGIFVDLLPPVLPEITVTTLANNLIEGNQVFKNNRPNTADPSDLAAAEPPGEGILIVGGTHLTVNANIVTNNNTGGIVLLSGQDLVGLGALPPGAFDGLDPNPEQTLVENNIVLGNGNHPSDPTQPSGDLLATPNALAGAGNHWRHNLFNTSFPPELP